MPIKPLGEKKQTTKHKIMHLSHGWTQNALAEKKKLMVEKASVSWKNDMNYCL